MKLKDVTKTIFQEYFWLRESIGYMLYDMHERGYIDYSQMEDYQKKYLEETVVDFIENRIENYEEYLSNIQK